MADILIIDDNAGVRAALRLLFELQDHTVSEAALPEPALQLLQQDPQRFDVIVQDMNFEADTTSGEEGVALFKALRALNPDQAVVLLTAWSQLDQAVSLVRLGAADYLAKPWDDNKLSVMVGNLIELSEARRAHRQALAMEQQLSTKHQTALSKLDLRGLVFASRAMGEVLSKVQRVAATPHAVLISGPNGSGKEGIAELLHYNSMVKHGPLVTLNCGAIPQDLLEAELFGAEAGAYTGANKSREGKFEAADGGTLFLDEVGNLSLTGQMKLLRVLETSQFQRLGSNFTRKVKVRVVSATNADLSAMIQKNQFREDLYYRLNVIELMVPELNQRIDDIAPLASRFLQDSGKRLSESALLTLQNYPWPGNVRELKNRLLRASLLADGETIQAHDLELGEQAKMLKATGPNGPSGPNGPNGPAGPTGASGPSEPTREEIIAALEIHQGVVSDAATQLGMSRQSLYRRMERFAIGKLR